jgi:uncharacterized protein (TIRG00374 family)
LPQDYLKPWAWAVPLLAALGLLLVWQLDANRSLFLLFNQASHYTGAVLWENITTFGDSLAVFSLALLFIGRRPQLLWILMFSAMVSTVVVHGMKEWALVMRPPAIIPADELTVIGTAHKAVSFPSGHTTAVFTLAALLCLQQGVALGWRIALLLLAVLVGISRMAVGVHWPMDVLGGALIAWCSVLVGYFFAPQIPWGTSRGAQRFFAVLLVLVAVALIFFHDSGYPHARVLEVLIPVVSLVLALPKLRELFFTPAPAEAVEHASSNDLPSDMPSGPRSYRGVVIRLLVTMGLFWLIFRSVDVRDLLDSYRDIVPRLLLLGVVFQMLSTTLAAYRWYLVMRPLGYQQGFGFYLKSYFKGTFFNQGLPTSIGGDAVRVLDVARLGERKRDAFIGVFIDRVLGLVGLLLLNLVVNVFNPALLPQELFVTINILISLGLLGFVVLYLLQHWQWLQRWRLSRFLYKISRHLGWVLATPRQSVLQFALSVAVHFLSLLAIFLIGRSVELNFSLTTYLVLVPPAILLTLIPLSLAGWGIREGALIGLFTLLGADKVTVLSMSILYGIVLIVASLPGLVVYLKGKHHI